MTATLEQALSDICRVKVTASGHLAALTSSGRLQLYDEEDVLVDERDFGLDGDRISIFHAVIGDLIILLHGTTALSLYRYDAVEKRSSVTRASLCLPDDASESRDEKNEENEQILDMDAFESNGLCLAVLRTKSIEVYRLDGGKDAVLRVRVKRPLMMKGKMSCTVMKSDVSIVAMDLESTQVDVLDDKGQQCFSWNGQETLGLSSETADMCVDQRGHVIIADRGNARCQVCSLEGHPLWTFCDDGERSLIGARLVAADSEGNIFVAFGEEDSTFCFLSWGDDEETEDEVSGDISEEADENSKDPVTDRSHATDESSMPQEEEEELESDEEFEEISDNSAEDLHLQVTVGIWRNEASLNVKAPFVKLKVELLDSLLCEAQTSSLGQIGDGGVRWEETLTLRLPSRSQEASSTASIRVEIWEKDELGDRFISGGVDRLAEHESLAEYFHLGERRIQLQSLESSHASTFHLYRAGSSVSQQGFEPLPVERAEDQSSDVDNRKILNHGQPIALTEPFRDALLLMDELVRSILLHYGHRRVSSLARVVKHSNELQVRLGKIMGCIGMRAIYRHLRCSSKAARKAAIELLQIMLAVPSNQRLLLKAVDFPFIVVNDIVIFHVPYCMRNEYEMAAAYPTEEGFSAYLQEKVMGAMYSRRSLKSSFGAVVAYPKAKQSAMDSNEHALGFWFDDPASDLQETLALHPVQGFSEIRKLRKLEEIFEEKRGQHGRIYMDIPNPAGPIKVSAVKIEELRKSKVFLGLFSCPKELGIHFPTGLTNWEELRAMHMFHHFQQIKRRESIQRRQVIWLRQEKLLVRNRPICVDVYGRQADQKIIVKALDMRSSRMLTGSWAHENADLDVLQLDAEELIAMITRLWIPDEDLEQLCKVAKVQRCELAFKPRSFHSDESINVTFKNHSKETASIFWVDYEGENVHMSTVAPRESWNTDSFRTHVWLCKSDGGSAMTLNGDDFLMLNQDDPAHDIIIEERPSFACMMQEKIEFAAQRNPSALFHMDQLLSCGPAKIMAQHHLCPSGWVSLTPTLLSIDSKDLYQAWVSFRTLPFSMSSMQSSAEPILMQNEIAVDMMGMEKEDEDGDGDLPVVLAVRCLEGMENMLQISVCRSKGAEGEGADLYGFYPLAQVSSGEEMEVKVALQPRVQYHDAKLEPDGCCSFLRVKIGFRKNALHMQEMPADVHLLRLESSKQNKAGPKNMQDGPLPEKHPLDWLTLGMSKAVGLWNEEKYQHCVEVLLDFSQRAVTSASGNRLSSPMLNTLIHAIKRAKLRKPRAGCVLLWRACEAVVKAVAGENAEELPGKQKSSSKLNRKLVNVHLLELRKVEETRWQQQQAKIMSDKRAKERQKEEEVKLRRLLASREKSRLQQKVKEAAKAKEESRYLGKWYQIQLRLEESQRRQRQRQEKLHQTRLAEARKLNDEKIAQARAEAERRRRSSLGELNLSYWKRAGKKKTSVKKSKRSVKVKPLPQQIEVDEELLEEAKRRARAYSNGLKTKRKARKSQNKHFAEQVDWENVLDWKETPLFKESE